MTTKAKKWEWKQGDAGFKNGKLYLGCNDDSVTQPKELATRVIVVRACDGRRWALIKKSKQTYSQSKGQWENIPQPLKQRGSKAKLPLSRILNFAKSDERKEEGPYAQFIAAVGKENIKLAIKCRIKQAEILSRILSVDGYKELLIRFPLAAKTMAIYTPERCRRLLKLSDRELAGAIDKLRSGERIVRMTSPDPTVVQTMGTKTKVHLRQCKGHPVTKAELKALKKVHINSSQNLWVILDSWRRNNTKTKYHITKVSDDMLSLLSEIDKSPLQVMPNFVRQAERITNKLNKKGQPSAEFSLMMQNFRDAERQAEMITEHGKVPVNRAIQTLKDVKELHDELTLQLHSIEEENRPLPEAWVPNSEYITAIPDTDTLKEEGVQMHHCCYSYKSSIMRGDCCIYRVQKGEHRGTLELYKNMDGTVSIAQFRAVCNKPVEASLKREVDMWVLAHNKEVRDAPEHNPIAGSDSNGLLPQPRNLY